MSEHRHFSDNNSMIRDEEPAHDINNSEFTHWNSNTVTNLNTSHGHATTYFTFGSVLCVLFVIGLFEHILVLIVFCKNKQIKTDINTYIVGLVLGGIGQLFLTIPLAILSNLYGRWLFGDSVCQYYGFVMTSLGISQISLLTVISVKRYLIIVKHSRTYTNNQTKSVLTILMCYVFGSLCAVGPVVGWSRYDVEMFGTTCSIHWDDRAPSSLSYVGCLFTLGFFLPLIVITWCYVNIALKIYRMRANALTSKLHGGKTRKRQFKEKRVTLTILIMIGAFIISWCPYAVISLYTSIHGTSGIPHGYFMVPPIIAKSSILWNPVIYIWRNKEFRNALVNTLKLDLCYCATEHGNCLGNNGSIRSTELEVCDTNDTLHRETPSDVTQTLKTSLKIPFKDAQLKADSITVTQVAGDGGIVEWHNVSSDLGEYV